MKKKLMIGLVFIIMLCVGFLFLKFKETKEASDALVFQKVDITKVKDGTYVGKCQTGLVKVVVSIEVKDGRLQTIDLLSHENGLGSKAEENLDIMLKENRLDVDVVSGATISARAIRKASEAALLSE